MAPEAPKTARVAALDGLRGVAVAAVLADHLWPGGSLGTFLPVGMTGVKLFFVLSGYLITGILLRGASRADAAETTRGRVLWSFYARRFLRIFPVYYLVLGLAAALDLGEVRASLGWHAAYASNFYVALVAKAWPPFTGHFWSLALEEQFYVLWPWLVLLTPAAGRRTVIVATIGLTLAARVAAVASGMGSHALAVLPIGSLDALALGALLASLERGDGVAADWRRRLDRVALWGAAPALVALLAMQRAGAGEDVRRVLWPLCVALLFFRLVGAAADPASARLRRVLEWRPLVRVGEISYGIYLFHPFVAHGVMAMFGVAKVTNLTVSLACVAASLVVAEVSWRLVEAPLLRWKDRFVY